MEDEWHISGFQGIGDGGHRFAVQTGIQHRCVNAAPPYYLDRLTDTADRPYDPAPFILKRFLQEQGDQELVLNDENSASF
jgi:hypothetical protein